MQFIVPQFIDKKSKIVGPFSFGELIFIVITGVICIFLFFTVSFSAFVVSAIFLIGGALALLFIKIEGNSLPTVIKNFSVYFLNPKVYLWKKKTFTATIKLTDPEELIKIKEAAKKREKKEMIATSPKSNLRRLHTDVETRPR